jgi:hypothetical protein
MSDRPAVTMDATVQKIIRSPDPRIPDKAEIGVERTNELYREIRIENTLTDEQGNRVELKQGARVDVTLRQKRAKRPARSTSKRVTGEGCKPKVGCWGFSKRH